MEIESGRSGERPWWALVISVAGMAVALWLVVGPMTSGEAPGHEATPMLQVSPAGEVELASLPTEHQVLYEAAAADREAFTAVRCYCGCEDFLGHRHLLDCFERPEGGWERHATGCAVCLAEAEEVVEQRAAGTPLDEIVRRIDNRYGQITATT
ncbi:MAG: PCYCGC motif-containing (lipo)protein [Nitriliruptoraceae bacterium]